MQRLFYIEGVGGNHILMRKCFHKSVFISLWFVLFSKGLCLEILANLEVLMKDCFKGMSRVWVVVVLVLQYVANIWAASTSLETLENRPVLRQNESSSNEYQTESLLLESEIRTRAYTGFI